MEILQLNFYRYNQNLKMKYDKYAKIYIKLE